MFCSHYNFLLIIVFVVQTFALECYIAIFLLQYNYIVFKVRCNFLRFAIIALLRECNFFALLTTQIYELFFNYYYIIFARRSLFSVCLVCLY